MANGYCPPILAGIKSVGLTDPSTKLRTPGFLQMLLCCMDGSVQAQPFEQRFQNGHIRPMSVYYYDRVPESLVQDGVNACDNLTTQGRKEFVVPDLITKSISFGVEYDKLRQYCSDASDPVNLNGRPTPVMREVYDLFIKYAGALVSAIDTTLVTQMSTQFGTNVVTGNNAAEVINLDPSDPLNRAAIVKLLSEWRENEFCQDPCIVGTGPFADRELYRQALSSTSAIGLNPQQLDNVLPRVWYDKATRSIWGENQIGVFEKGSLAFLSAPRYPRTFAGKIANTERFSTYLPVDEYTCPPECLNNFIFDVQIREVDCAQNLTVNGVADTPFENGVQVTISKDFTLFVKPSSLYVAGDPLAGTNGTLRYQINEANPFS